DGPDIVADDVLAERVELGALAPEQAAVLAVELPQPGELLRQVSATAKRGEHAHCPRRDVPALPAGQPAGMRRATRVGCACALGGHESRTMARSGRPPGFSIVSVMEAVSPSRTLVSPDRVIRGARTPPASIRSAAIAASSTPLTASSTAVVRKASTTSAPVRAARAARLVSATGHQGRAIGH